MFGSYVPEKVGRTVNGVTPSFKFIGWLEVEAGEYHRANFECAAWWEDHVYDSQTVPVFVSPEWGGQIRDVCYSIDSTIIAENFGSYFGGVACGTRGVEHVVKPASFGRRPYAYSFARQMLESPDGFKFRPAPGVSAVPVGKSFRLIVEGA